jgi:cytochrome c
MDRSRLLLAAALALGLSAPAAQAADGARTFQLQCKTCHGAKSTAMGPALNGVAGAKIAGRADFNYSAGLKAKAGTWTDANLEAYLAAPAKFAPGTRMLVAVANPADRAAVAAYLKTLK